VEKLARARPRNRARSALTTITKAPVTACVNT
jgi:hypothetical protein